MAEIADHKQQAIQFDHAAIRPLTTPSSHLILCKSEIGILQLLKGGV